MKKKIKNEIKYSDMQNIIRTYFKLIIPVVVVYILVFNFISDNQIQKTKEVIRGEQKQRVKTISYILEDIFEELEEDLMVIKDSDEISMYINQPNGSNLVETKEMFLRIANKKKNFDQIRFIDRDGNEIIRVNNGSEAYLVPDSDLQNKKDRYYYKETSQLDEGEIFISDMDLNVENGQVEVPHKPMVRIGTPLYSYDNVYQGILIVNYLGNDLLDIFNDQFQDSEYSFIENILINKDGYYLYSKEIDRNFGFMFDEKQGYTISKEEPELWDKMSLHNNGYYEDNNKGIFYTNIKPLKKLNTDNIDYAWTIISMFNLDDLPIIKQNILFGMKTIDVIILIGIIFLLFIIVFISYFRKKDRGQLDITTRIARNTNDAVVITDKNTRIIYVNKVFEAITGYTKDEVIGLKTNSFKSGKHSDKFYQQMWDSINSTGSWQGKLWDKKKDGMFYPKELSIISVHNKSGRGIDKYIGIFTDLTRLEEEKQNVKILKNYNLETNLPNENLLKKLIDKSISSSEKKFGVICFSIVNYNNIQLINETQHYVNNLIEDIQDTISKDDFIAQISKNIFIIGMSYNNEEKLKNFVNLFFEKIKMTNFNDEDVILNIKAGISIYPDNGLTSNELINNANIALEKALNRNEKKYIYYTPTLKENIEKELQYNILLKKAIVNNELDVYYQPQVQIDNGKIVGAEALLRWNSSKLGNISPGVFIPLAEKTGDIIEIGYWLIERIFKDYVSIKNEIKGDFRISINVSPLQFKDSKLVSKLKELAKKYEVDLSSFEIEITESIFMSDVNMVNKQLDAFKKLGMTIAIDDFGTGFSSLSYLKDLNIDKLKIDRSFIKDYPEHDNGGIAKVITNMANELNLKVITEGAEKKEQIDYLQSVGCNLIQGYYYSKPLNILDFHSYYMKNIKEK